MVIRPWPELLRSDYRGIESLDNQPDAKRQFPEEFRDGRDDLPHRACLEDPDRERNTVQHRASERKENPLDMGVLQTPANLCNA
jgi:hypothetical protein